MKTQRMSNETLVNLLLERLGRQDAPGIADLFNEKIDWYVPGDHQLPWIGKRSNRIEVSGYFQTMWPHFVQGMSIAQVRKVILSDNDVIILATFSHVVRSTGRSFETPVAMHLTVTNGKFDSMHLYEDTLAVSNAFFGIDK